MKSVHLIRRAAAGVLAAALVLALAACGGTPASSAPVKAAEPAVVLAAPARPKATSPSATTMKVRWQAVEGATHYYVVYATAQLTAEQVEAAALDPQNTEASVLWVDAKTDTAPGANFEGMQKGTTYYIGIVAGCQDEAEPADLSLSPSSILISTTTPAK